MGLLQQNKHAEKKTGNDQALEAEFQLLMTVSNQKICKSLPFFYFLTFEKGRLLYMSHCQMLGKFEYTLPAKF